MKIPNPYDEWHHEANLSKSLVIYLLKKNYQIEKNNSDNIKKRGVDIIAIRDGKRDLIEVKGYPSRFYMDRKKKGMKKKTKPETQAKHWFSQVITATIFNYSNLKRGDQVSIALPDQPTYLRLIQKASKFFVDHNIFIKIYLVDKNAIIRIIQLNNPKD
jgi:hypothetical protein